MSDHSADDDPFVWNSDYDSSENEEIVPDRVAFEMIVDSDSSEEIDEADDDDALHIQQDSFKKLSRSHRDRRVFLQLKTLVPVKVHLSSLDILDSARRFLSKNTINLCKRRTATEIEIIPELNNLRRFERARQGMILRRSDAIQRPQSARLFDYVFAQPRIEGRELTYTITQTDAQTFPNLTDLQIAQLISKSPAERIKLAPHAWIRDSLRPEYCHVAHLVDHHGAPIMTPKQIKLVARAGRKQGMSESQRTEYRQLRAAQANKAYWKISIIDSTRGKKKYGCPICGRQVAHAQLHMDSWHINYGPRPSFPVVKHDNPLGIPETAADFTVCLDQYPDREIVERVVQGMIEFLLRWKLPFNLRAPHEKSLLLAIAARRVGATVLYTKPRVLIKQDAAQATEIASYSIHLVDPLTHKYYRQNVRIDPSRLQNLHPPPVPSWVSFNAPMSIRVESIKDSDTEANAAPQVKGALALQQYIAYQMEWKEISKANARTLIDFYINQFGYAAPHKQDQNGQDEANSTPQPAPLPLGLVDVCKDRQSGISLLSPTELLSKGVTKPLNVVIVHSVKGSEIAVAVNAAIAQWMINGSPIDTWHALNRAADALNADIDQDHPLESVCRCEKDAADFCFHPCDICMLLTVCANLQRYETDSGEVLRICRFCFDKAKARLARANARANARAGGKVRLRRNLQGMVRHETKSLDIPTADKIRQFEDVWGEIQEYITSEGQAEDAYTATSVDISLRSTTVRRDVLSLSIEAVFPYTTFPDHDKRPVFRVHGQGNVIFTLLCNNLGKHISLPGVLHLAAYCWSHLKPQSTSQTSMAIVHARIIEQANDMHLVRLNTPYKVRSRLQIPYEEEEYNRIRDDWVRGAPRDEDRGSLMRKRAYVNRRYREPDEWEGFPPEHERIMGLVRELEDKSGKKVTRGNDGCPFPFPGDPPDDWTWWMCWCLFSERVSRMWNWCNGLWEQLDCTETLFLVAIQSELGLLGPEPFRLPLSIYIKHPLRFAVAHKIHKQQIRSGWETDSPSHFREFNPALHNMELQTAFSNFFLSDVVNEAYPAVQDEILKIMIPPKWYNPTHLLAIHREQVDEDISSIPDELDLSLISLNLGTYESASLRRYASMLIDHSSSEEWIQKDIIWDNFVALENNHRTRFHTMHGSGTRPQIGAGKVTEDPAGQVSITANAPVLKKSAKTIRGLENANLLCWLNSTVRLLKNIKPLQQKIISFNTIEFIDPYGDDTELISFQAKIVSLLAKAMIELDIESRKPLRLTELANACSKVERVQWDETQMCRKLRGERTGQTSKFVSKWRPGHNQDPEEFLQWLLPILVELGVVSDDELESLLNVKTIEEVRCASCFGEQSSTRWMDKSTDITLKLVFPNWTATSETLGTLFKHTFRGEDNIEYAEACPRNIIGHDKLYRKTWLGGLAEYVIIHLVRTGANEEGVQVRIPAAIQERPEIDFSAIGKPGVEFENRYKLVAEIQHIGDYSTPFNGHYIAYSKQDDEWIKFNDDYITFEEPWAQRPGELSYLLLYKCDSWEDSTLLATEENTTPTLEDEITYISDTPEKILSPEPSTTEHKIEQQLPKDSKTHGKTRPLEIKYSPKSNNSSEGNDISLAKEIDFKNSRLQVSVIEQEDLISILPLDPIKEKYVNNIVRYFDKFKALDGSCSNTELLIYTFDGMRSKDGKPNSNEETVALLKIWREALSTVAYQIPRAKHVNYWKIRMEGHQLPGAPSGSDRNSWDISSTESESESDDGVVPVKIWGTSFKHGVMCFVVSWTPVPGLADEQTWEPVKGFWERWEHLDSVREMIEQLAKTWKFN